MMTLLPYGLKNYRSCQDTLFLPKTVSALEVVSLTGGFHVADGPLHMVPLHAKIEDPFLLAVVSWYQCCLVC